MSLTRKGIPSVNKGKKYPNLHHSKQFNKGFTPWNKGLKGYKSGKSSHLWKGGITPLTKTIRHCFKYRQWHSDIFERDDYTCQKCGKRGVRLHVDHIKAFARIFEENHIKSLEDAINCEEFWNINNGRTLCKECHKKTDTYGGKYKKLCHKV